MAKPKRTRVQNAEEVARAAFFFVKKAREDGYANKITDMTLMDSADGRGLRYGTDYTISTVRKYVRDLCVLFEMNDIIDF